MAGRVYIKPTDEEIAHELIRHKGKLSLTAKALAVDSTYVRLRIRENPEVNAAYQHARDMIVDIAEQVILKHLYRDSERAAEFILTTLGKDRGYTSRTEITGKDGAELEVTLNLGRSEINTAEDTEELGGEEDIYDGEIIDGIATVSTEAADD
jgi:hypothetical protein